MWSPTLSRRQFILDDIKYQLITLGIGIIIILCYIYFSRRNQSERVIKVKYISSQGYNLKIIDIEGVVYTASLSGNNVNKKSIVDMTVGNTYRIKYYGSNNILSAELISQP
jgi:uncharacterized protein YjhX (UPF0386 family)